MNDTELEIACKGEISGSSNWYNWSSELYSFGKCFRHMARYPKFLPIFVTSDHGVGLGVNLFSNELNSKSKVHLTWNPVKESRYKNSSNPRVIRVPHPWIHYRRTFSRSRSLETKGTLVFFTHHVPGIIWEGHDTEEYFAQLRALPTKFQPVVLCLHMHDINAGHHKKLRQHGFPLVTVGNTSSTKFVDHFYDLIKDYAYACSPDWGSHAAYCVELGIPYFFLGNRPKLINMSHTDMQLGEVVPLDNSHVEIQAQAEKLFSLPVAEVTPEQCAFVESMLGLDSRITSGKLSRILWCEFFSHWLHWPGIVRFNLSALLHKMGCLELIKEFLRYFNFRK